MLQQHHGQSGFKLLTKGEDALLLRIALIQAAQHSLDMQYYIIEDDMTGKFLLSAIMQAADRNVRVRILVDDVNLHASDHSWLALNMHRNIAIRVFNPFAIHSEPLLKRIRGVLARILHFNKRMHNKSIVCDNQLAIIGGRNLGDAYFDASKDFNLRDLDVLAVGPIVPTISESFDMYWNSEESFPVATVFKPLTGSARETLSSLRRQLEEHWIHETKKENIAFLIPLTEQFENNQLTLLWADAELLVDSPVKIEMPDALAESKPWCYLEHAIGSATQECIIVSPYFLADIETAHRLIALVKRGVRVRILTNSLASTTSVPAYSGYQRYRTLLVQGGIELYEMKPIPGTHPRRSRFYSSSSGGLHSKVYVVDRRDSVIGSFNFDPRSVHLNTEMVLAIHSQALASEALDMFDKGILPEASYQLVMHDSHLTWVTQENGMEKIYTHEPKTGIWRNVKAFIYAALPIENEL
jgi:putative cardiolipin synthase